MPRPCLYFWVFFFLLFSGTFLARGVSSLSVQRLEGPTLSALLEGNAELEQLDDDLAEVVEEKVIVLGVLLDPLLHGLVLGESVVRRKHHESLGSILELPGTIPLTVCPLLAEEQGVVVVGQHGGREGPGAIEPTSVGVAAAKGMGTGEGDDLLVVEAHPVEDISQMISTLGPVGKTPVRSAECDIPVLPARAVGDSGTQHLLYRSDAAQNPKVGVGDPRELGYQVRVSFVFYFTSRG